MSKIFVTGCAGFIGSHLFDELTNRGHEVWGCDDLSGSALSNVETRPDRVLLLPCEHPEVRDFLETGGFDTLVHCAANAREGASQFQPMSVTARNLGAYAGVLGAALQGGVKSVCVYSSMAVYGGQKPPFEEALSPAPEDVYAWNKTAMEGCTKILSDVHGFKYVIIRPHNCFDPETEILTRDRGWVFFEDLRKTDYVATLNEANQLEWNKPTEYQRIFHDGPLYHFNGQQIDMMVTGDHHLYIKKTDSAAYQFVRAEDAYNSRISYSWCMKGDAGWVGEEVPTKILEPCCDSMGRPDPRNPRREIAMDDWIQLSAWIVTEGSIFKTPTNYIVNITKFDKNTQREIIDLAVRCGYAPYMNGENDIRIHSKQLYEEFVGMSGAHNKRIPEDLKNLSRRQLQILFDTLMRGDGDRKNARRYSTVSFGLAGDFQELAIKLGYRATIKKEERLWKGDPSFVYRVGVNKSRRSPQLGDNRKRRTYCDKVHYTGYVYDVTVKNHVILVRRGGRALWSGNCMGPRQCLSDRFRNAVAIFMNLIMRGEPITIYGDGLQTRAFSYIADSLPSFVRCAEEVDALHGQIINIGGIAPISVLDMAHTVIMAMGEDYTKYPVIHLPDRPCEVKHAHCTFQKSQDLLGYKEKWGWHLGIYEMAEWAKAQGPQEWTNTDPVEISNDKLPEPWREFVTQKAEVA